MKVHVEIDGHAPTSAIAARFGYDRDLVDAVKTLPGARFISRDKAHDGRPYWRLPCDLETCHALRSVFGDALVIGPALKGWATREVQRSNALVSFAGAADATLSRLPGELPTFFDKLYPFQRSGAAFVALADGALIADEPGLGKTYEAIAGIVEAGALEGLHLVVAPKTTLDNVWARMLREVQPVPVLVITKVPDVTKVIRAAREGESLWVVVNAGKIRYAGYRALEEVKWTNVIIDECHKEAIRNPKTVTAEVLNGLAVSGKRIALSGTPMRNRPTDLWGILHWLRPDVFTSKWRWAEQWCEVEDNGYGKTIGNIRQEVREEFYKHISPYVLRRTKEEVFKELPPKTYVDIWLDMEGEQKRQYISMAKDAEAEVEGGDIVGLNMLSIYTRMKQFASAPCSLDEAGEVQPQAQGSNKLAAVFELLEERGIFDSEGDSQVVIFSQFSKMVDIVHAALVEAGVPAAKLTGKTTQAKRNRIQDDFQAEGGARVLCMTTTAGGVGITLDRADAVVFLDETWTPDDQLQAEDRVHRVSRIHNVTVYYLRTKGTVEEYIMDLVLEKSEIAKAILDDRRKLRLR